MDRTPAARHPPREESTLFQSASIATRHGLAGLGLAFALSTLVAGMACSASRVIGETPQGVRILRGPASAPAAAPPADIAPGDEALFAPPPADADSAARAWATRMIGAYGGTAAFTDWLERGVRRGVQITYSPMRIDARYVERRSGARIRLEARVAGFDFVVVSTPDEAWQSIYGIVSETPEHEREYIAAVRAHAEDLLLMASRGTLPARVEPRPHDPDTVSVLIWGPRGSATRFRAARADARLATLEFFDRSPETPSDALHLARFTDWRALGPREATRRARHEGHAPLRMHEFVSGKHQADSYVDTLDLASEVPEALFHRPGAAPVAEASPRRSILALEHLGDHHFADVRFADGSARRFLVDSGAGVTAISRTLAAELGVVPEEALDIAGVGGDAAAQSALLPPFQLGAHRLSGVRGIVLDLASLSVGLGTPIEGVLGVSAFARFAVTWDFERGVLEFAETRDPQPTGAHGTRVPFTMSGGLVFAPVQVDGGTPSDFVIDTGAWRTILSGPLGAAVTNPPERRLPGIPYSGVDGRRLATEALRLRSLEIGGQVISRPIVLAPSTREPADALGALTRDRGVLGLDVLRRFRLTLDFPRQEMLLEPRRAPLEADDAAVIYFCGPGVALTPGERGTGATIARVLADSPAAKAGMAVGDRVLAIDGRNLDGATTAQLADVLAGESGSHVELKVRKTDGRERTVDLVRTLLL